MCNTIFNINLTYLKIAPRCCVGISTVTVGAVISHFTVAADC